MIKVCMCFIVGARSFTDVHVAALGETRLHLFEAVDTECVHCSHCFELFVKLNYAIFDGGHSMPQLIHVLFVMYSFEWEPVTIACDLALSDLLLCASHAMILRTVLAIFMFLPCKNKYGARFFEFY